MNTGFNHVRLFIAEEMAFWALMIAPRNVDGSALKFSIFRYFDMLKKDKDKLKNPCDTCGGNGLVWIRSRCFVCQGRGEKRVEAMEKEMRQDKSDKG